MKRCVPGMLLLLAIRAHAWDVDGFIDLRAVHSNTDGSWTEAGLGKQRYDGAHDGVRLGQALFTASGDLADTLDASATISADDTRHHTLDVTEAYLRWRPIPVSAWRTTLKAGAFFAPFSLENDGPGWTTTRTLSASAINAWLGEELRTKGLELDVWRPGRFIQSAHDVGITLGVFQGNESSGALLAYRGWSIGDRITGLTETIRLADIPIFGAQGPLATADKRLDDFHQLDGRTGYYAGARYGYGNRLSLAGYHYDNRADPLVYAHKQWGWHTRFDLANLRLTPGENSEVLAQWMGGDTQWGKRLTRVDFRAWYALADYRWGKHLAAVRYDRFRTHQAGFEPTPALDDDYYAEEGHALALSYHYALNDDLDLAGEWLRVASRRPARELIGQEAQQLEHSLSLALRWRF